MNEVELLEGEERVFTLKQVSRLSINEKKPKGFSRQYLNKEIERGNLKAVKFDGIYVVREEEMRRYLNKKNIFLFN